MKITVDLNMDYIEKRLRDIKFMEVHDRYDMAKQGGQALGLLEAIVRVLEKGENNE